MKLYYEVRKTNGKSCDASKVHMYATYEPLNPCEDKNGKTIGKFETLEEAKRGRQILAY